MTDSNDVIVTTFGEIQEVIDILDNLHDEVRHLTLLLLMQENGISQEVLDSLQRLESFDDINQYVKTDSNGHYYLLPDDLFKILGKDC